jgi:hypothetical protein
MSTSHGKARSCARCGILRKQVKGPNVLCTDCRYVLTEEERKMWNREPVAA